MAKKNQRAKPKNKKKTKSPTPGRLTKFLIYLLVFGTFVFATYMGYLDYTVRQQFAGKRWSIPARVYASPVELYAGLELGTRDFENLLTQLHYHRDYQLSGPGSFYKKNSAIYLKTRRFVFWDGQQESQALKIQFKGKSVARLTRLDTSQDIPVIRLDPVQIGSFYPTLKEDRVLIKMENAPDHLINGLLATEDRNFYSHFGISFKAIARALYVNLKAGSVVQGGSTITQQLVKNFYLSAEKTLIRKINEALIALILEYRFNKDEILEAYLNEIYLGQDKASAIHGFGLASEFYFGRPLDSLDLPQIAMLVAMVRGPSYYDPRRHPDRAIQRRNLVLDEMYKQGFISELEAQPAKQSKLYVVAKTHRPANRYPAFLDLVKRQLRQEYRNEDLTSEGLRIFTTLDPFVQNKLENTIKKKLSQLEKKPKVSKLQTASLVTRRDSGEIVALMGSRKADAAGFNRALDAVRPIGSLIKPVIYLTALEYPQKYTAITKISDTSITVKGAKGKDWTPKNYDNLEHGDVELHTALSRSYNLATVRIGMDVGIARTAKTLRDMGVNREVKLYPSLLLGASPLTPLEVTQLYQTLAGDGFATPLRSIREVVAQNGERLQSYPYTVRQTVDPAAAYITNTLLQEAMQEGTGRSAYLYLPSALNLAGKTGTTNKLRDSWFAGFSGDYLSVVWIGRDDNKPAGLTGASGALQVWIELMKHIARQPVVLIPPETIEMQWIDPSNGLLADEECDLATAYPFVSGSAPLQHSPCVETSLDKAKTWFNDFLLDNF